MVKVVLRKGESTHKLMGRFRKAVSMNGVMRDVRQKRWFISKNEQRRIAQKKAIRRLKRKQVNRNDRSRRRY